jgi:hypothetical protein
MGSLNHVSKFVPNITNLFDNGVKRFTKVSVNNFDLKKFCEHNFFSKEEDKLNVLIGEFIYFSGKHLMSSELRSHIRIIEKDFISKKIKITPLFYGINVLPIAYPCPWGCLIDKTPEGNSVKNKGFRFEDEVEILKSLDFSKKKIQLRKE